MDFITLIQTVHAILPVIMAKLSRQDWLNLLRTCRMLYGFKINMECRKVQLIELLKVLGLRDDSHELNHYFADYGGKLLCEKIFTIQNFLDKKHQSTYNRRWNTNYLILPMDLFGRIKHFGFLCGQYNVPMYIRGLDGTMSVRDMIWKLLHMDTFSVSFFGKLNSPADCTCNLSPSTIVSITRNGFSITDCGELMTSGFIVPLKFCDVIDNSIVFTISIVGGVIEFLGCSRINSNLDDKRNIVKIVTEEYVVRYGLDTKK